MAYRPTDRERQRYVVYEGADPLPTFRTLYGVHGEADAGLQRHGPGVIRTTATGVDRVRAAIALTPGCHSVRVGVNLPTAKADGSARNQKPPKSPAQETRSTRNHQ
jgi:hypothetical protein